jgi:hypothetical protein
MIIDWKRVCQYLLAQALVGYGLYRLHACEDHKMLWVFVISILFAVAVGPVVYDEDDEESL